MALTEDQKELLQATMDRIDAVPEQWQQGDWGVQTPCGTKACFAGHAVMIAMPEVQPPRFDPDQDGYMPTWQVDGRHVSDVAESLLGLSPDQARCLFDGANTRRDLRMMVRELIRTDGSVSLLDLCAATHF